MIDPDPSRNQTKEEIAEYYRNAKVGDPACIRMTWGSMDGIAEALEDKGVSWCQHLRSKNG